VILQASKQAGERCTWGEQKIGENWGGGEEKMQAIPKFLSNFVRP